MLRSHRPFSVTLVLSGVFLIGLANGWRALGLLRQSGLLLDLGASPDPRWCAVGSAAWSIVLLLLAYVLWRRKSYSRLVVPAVLLAYGLYQFVLSDPCAPFTQFQDGPPAIAVLYAVAVLLAALALNLGAGRLYFVDDQDPESERSIET